MEPGECGGVRQALDGGSAPHDRRNKLVTQLQTTLARRENPAIGFAGGALAAGPGSGCGAGAGEGCETGAAWAACEVVAATDGAACAGASFSRRFLAN